MKNNSLSKIIFGVVGVIVAFYYFGTFIVDQTQYAVKIVLGDPTQVYKTPGLRFQIPFITKIFFVDNRLIMYDADPGSIFTKDKKEMRVDNYAKWRVTDPKLFYETMRDTTKAQERLQDLIYSQVRQVLGKHTLSEIVSGGQVRFRAPGEEEFDLSGAVNNSATDDAQATASASQTTQTDGTQAADQTALESNGNNITLRQSILDEITANARNEAKEFGIEVLDVRIKRADLPDANSRAVYGRMEAERRRDAKRYRSEGDEQALGIRSAADREKVSILAQAEKEAEIIRGGADAKALTIYAEAYTKDPDFFKFQRSHDAYRESLKDGATLLLSSERDFFQALK